MATGKTFYIETFGCQMNAHDSEKVVGTLLQKGYIQVETVEAAPITNGKTSNRQAITGGKNGSTSGRASRRSKR